MARAAKFTDDERKVRTKVQIYHDTDPGVPDLGIDYMHCARCVEEWQRDFQDILSPKQYSRQQVGLTRDGLQVWCTRHEINISLLTFRAESEARP